LTYISSSSSSAYDKAIGKNVAIKKISKLTDPIVMRRTLREVKLLRHFRNSPNIVKLIEVLPVHDKETNEM
jgi:serine/threonine protein kinase